MTLAPALRSSNSDDWCTPREVIDRVLCVGPIALDPCSNEQSIVPAEQRICLPQNGLTAPWRVDGIVYVNPPYSRLQQRAWLHRCSTHPGEAIALIPARTDTAAWHDYASTADAICFWRGRLRFLGAPASAPFPSALLYWGTRADVFRSAFMTAGLVYVRSVRA